MKKYISDLTQSLKPYAGIIYFVVMLLGTHFLWKWVVDGDLNSQHIAIFGKNCTEQFYHLSQFTARLVYWFSSIFPGTDDLYLYDTHIYFYNNNGVNIIWGCTGVKQLYIYLTIMILYPGPWKKKLWYLPLTAFILFCYNIFRISAILFLIQDHIERFEFLHEGVFRYLYYIIIFLLWVYWEEIIRKKSVKSRK